MPKYYVLSGQLERVIEASSPEKACLLCLYKEPDVEIDNTFFYVDERGFRSPLRENGGSLVCLADGENNPRWTISTQKILDLLEDKKE